MNRLCPTCGDSLLDLDSLSDTVPYDETDDYSARFCSEDCRQKFIEQQDS